MVENSIEQKSKDILTDSLLTLYGEKYGIQDNKEGKDLIVSYISDIVSREEVYSPVIMNNEGKPASYFMAYCGDREEVIQDFSTEYTQYVSSILDKEVGFMRVLEEVDEFVNFIKEKTEKYGRMAYIIDMGGRLGKENDSINQYIMKNTSLILKNYFNKNYLSVGFWLADQSDPMVNLIDREIFNVGITEFNSKKIIKLELK